MSSVTTSGSGSMRLWWQSFVDAGQNAPYLERMATHLNAIADPGTSVEVVGMRPPDRDFGRLTEFRCAALAIDNAVEAAAQGYDAFVMGHFQDPGLYEARSAVRIPVIGLGESTLHWAAQLGRNIGLRHDRSRLRALASRAGRAVRARRARHARGGHGARRRGLRPSSRGGCASRIVRSRSSTSYAPRRGASSTRASSRSRYWTFSITQAAGTERPAAIRSPSSRACDARCTCEAP